MTTCLGSAFVLMYVAAKQSDFLQRHNLGASYTILIYNHKSKVVFHFNPAHARVDSSSTPPPPPHGRIYSGPVKAHVHEETR